MKKNKGLLWVSIVIALLVCLAGCSSSSSSGRKCAKSGCNRPAVTSGDSVYCSAHSNRCLSCGGYCDGDAAFCMPCLRRAFGK